MKDFITKVKAHKEHLKEVSDYNFTPKVSAVILSFNTATLHKGYAKQMVNSLRGHVDEIIVCEDGAIDNSREEWKGLLDHANDFLICTNDLCEVISYNRAIDLAKGDIICILQDDDVIPEDGQWIRDAVKLFNEYPMLGVLGGYEGQFPNTSGKGSFMHKFNTGDLPFKPKNLDIPFMFTAGVNIAPYFIQKTPFKAVGSFNTEYTKRGTLSDIFDNELCYKLWSKGFKVGCYRSGFKSGSSGELDGFRTCEEFNDDFSLDSSKNVKRLFNSFDLNELMEKVYRNNARLIPVEGNALDRYRELM